MIHHSSFLFAVGQILPPIQVLSSSLIKATDLNSTIYRIIAFHVTKELDPTSRLS